MRTIRRRSRRRCNQSQSFQRHSPFAALSLEEVEAIADFFYDDYAAMESFLVALSKDAKLVAGLEPMENAILLRSRSRVTWDHGETPGHNLPRRVEFRRGLEYARSRNSSADDFSVDSIFPHGSMHWPHTNTFEADETVALVSIKPRHARVLFAISRAEQNACDRACWCTRVTCTTVYAFLPLPVKLIVVGAIDGDTWMGPIDQSAVGIYESASGADAITVSKALGIPPHALGNLIRALVVSANICLCGLSSCEDIEFITCTDPRGPSFFDTFPRAFVAPNDVNFTLQSFTVNPYSSTCVSSPRLLLASLLPEISRRLAPLLKNVDLKSMRYALHGFEKSIKMPTNLELSPELQDEYECDDFYSAYL